MCLKKNKSNLRSLAWPWCARHLVDRCIKPKPRTVSLSSRRVASSPKATTNCLQSNRSSFGSNLFSFSGELIQTKTKTKNQINRKIPILLVFSRNFNQFLAKINTKYRKLNGFVYYSITRTQMCCVLTCCNRSRNYFSMRYEKHPKTE